jgi:CelD/BcsL family acetyltransferase involved in cellulose biosynthesis
MTTLTVELIGSDTGLHALASEWEALHRSVPDATPFQSPRWLLPWWHAFGTDCPCIAMLRHEDRLAGLLPLYILDEPPERKMLPIGIGITDYLDPLLEPGLPANAVGALLQTALDAGRQKGITACDLTDVPHGSVLRAVQAPPGWSASWRAGEPCPVLPVPDAATGLNDVLSTRMRRKLRMSRNRAARRGGWRVEAATATTLDQFVDALITLHGARWAEDGEIRGLADPAVRGFHHEAAPLLLQAGMLRLCSLWIENRIAACCHALTLNGRLFFYLSGFDASFAHESPGSILVGEMIAEAIAEGCREVHFLRGGEAYKYAWGGIDRPNAACHLAPA